jgi:hypothetical protein
MTDFGDDEVASPLALGVDDDINENKLTREKMHHSTIESKAKTGKMQF